jgi:2-methylcitrate dehydratase PrpD
MAVKAGVLHGKGFHPTGTNGAFGATAGASKILGLAPEEIMNALGICGSQSSALIQGTDEGVWTKRFNPGWAAHNGVTAATLAQMGFTGPKEVFEGRHGWYSAYAGDGTYDLGVILDEWGERFEIVNTSWKPYACNRYSHGPIDCAFEIRRQLGGAPAVQDVESIRVLTFEEALPFTAEPYEVKVRPRNTVDSQFSSYYAVSVALLTGRALLDEFSEEKIRDPEVLELASKVTIEADEELQKLYPRLYPAKVVLRMADGTTYEHMVETPKGDPEWDLTTDEVHERFRILGGRVFDEERVERILDTVMGAESIGDVGELMRLCVRD